ncbi:hypothetical protein LR48_Vigan02g129700 [Vigna angularis]|uniref:Uncharacterized protein n=1 Tax=Phaseolus angularis TaxID=3914 RepID=A0A0L9TXM7_PHAAN|nr:hypothetical protein LR48_Vigan02g129700 [Vigna angularis]
MGLLDAQLRMKQCVQFNISEEDQYLMEESDPEILDEGKLKMANELEDLKKQCVANKEAFEKEMEVAKKEKKE